MLNLVKQEPVMFQGLVQASLALAASFGLELSTAQIGAVLAFTAALLAFLTRSHVSPIARQGVLIGTKSAPGQTLWE